MNDFVGFGVSVEDIQRLHPKDRIYEMPLQEDDRYGESRAFEIADTFRTRMKCVGIDRKKGIAKYQRCETMHFGNLDV